MDITSRSTYSWPAPFFNLFYLGVLAGLIFVGQFLISYLIYADGRLSLLDNIRRVSLVQQAMQEPAILSIMKRDDIAILLSDPKLKRDEMSVTAWHYHGENCALDIYFSKASQYPDYVEYRALSLNHDVQGRVEDIQQEAINRYCLADVFDAQGVSAPESYAGGPLPSWDSPYRS